MEIHEFGREHAAGMLFFMDAAKDYAGARCCILNNLFVGFTLASQAIEKLLKAAISFEMKATPEWEHEERHNPFLLKNRLKSFRDYSLDSYDEPLKRLYQHFQRRYHDNPSVEGYRAESVELKIIDEIWLRIVDRLPIPKEVLLKTYFISNLCDQQIAEHWRTPYWYTVHNEALAPRLPELKKRYAEFNTYYATLQI